MASVGSIMWLGKQFWENTGSSKDKVIAADWLQSELMGNVVKIKAQDNPFTVDEGKEAELQNNLRVLLYC